jgi:NAD(P)-dependent dehydrogenase (short-subunit alcohol dehydrogenase family)
MNGPHKVAVITGASQGMGAGLSADFSITVIASSPLALH